MTSLRSLKRELKAIREEVETTYSSSGTALVEVPAGLADEELDRFLAAEVAENHGEWEIIVLHRFAIELAGPRLMAKTPQSLEKLLRGIDGTVAFHAPQH